ncbi:MAG TPA: putative N-acetylmannosamine-6-phosphate 2-epimerase [Bryobacteraceae bacterium]|nr:putative N-acetylmannosamine-6-phosphate 2-epimerase [Bryobacteraceae bacterium]
MTSFPPACSPVKNRLIVSCQAPDANPFREPESMARFARAAVDGGAAGIRANSPEDIRAIREVVDVPIIGLDKQTATDGGILITPTFESAEQLVRAGATVVALDCTARGQRYGALERLRRIRAELGVPVMADIATVEEAVAAAEAGADLVASTMRGYTQETAGVKRFEPEFVAGLTRAVKVPVLAEGMIGTPEEAAAAIAAGAFAVIVGTAITRPDEITRHFARAVEAEAARRRRGTGACVIGIDLGGTRTKFGVVSPAEGLIATGAAETPAGAGRDGLLAHLKRVAAEALKLARDAGLDPWALGVATAGWVNAGTGTVVYATENLPGWTGTRIADELKASAGLPVVVENDANAMAVAEKHFGMAREASDFACVTLGTGIGGGCYVGGKLNRGAHFFANGLGHIPIALDGIPCTCGRNGCLEPYANAAALVRYAGGGGSAEEVICAANAGDERARRAIASLAHHLGAGLASLVQLLDPSVLILSGGLTQNNPFLMPDLIGELSSRVPAWERRAPRVAVSELGYHAGVLGAAGIVLEAFNE